MQTKDEISVKTFITIHPIRWIRLLNINIYPHNNDVTCQSQYFVCFKFMQLQIYLIQIENLTPN